MKNFLLNGPLMTTPGRRQQLIERMAATLVRQGTAASDQDAVRSLFHVGGFSLVDIMVLAGEARALAFQEVVAREMSES